MDRKIIEKLYDKLFVPALCGGMAFLGYVLYNQGGADAIHKIYEKGGHVVLPIDDETVKF